MGSAVRTFVVLAIVFLLKPYVEAAVLAIHLRIVGLEPEGVVSWVFDHLVGA